MIKRLVFIFWLIPWSLGAQVVSASRATELACGVMGGTLNSLKSSLFQDSVWPIGNPDNPSAFVVTFKPAGFVIVSAIDNGSPVVGYSTTSSFPSNPDHPLLSWLIPSWYAKGSSATPKKIMQNSGSSTDRMVLPLTSARWGQGDPWNRFCPSDSTAKRALVGCVAVAMSQIMEKWQWPAKGTGIVTYTPMQHAEYGEISANFDTTRYHWDLTNDIYPTDASALILFHTGVASLMNYDPVLSSTSVDQYAIPALINNFSYNPGMIFRKMEGNDPGEWNRMLHQELDNSRPVLYAGTSPNGKSSHAFNIDGYRNETFFHFNWGWNGAGDGWYTLSCMAGGGSDFSTQQGAVFGLQPANIPLHDRPSALDILAGDKYVQLFWDQPLLADFSHFIIYRDEVVIAQTANIRFRDIAVENGRAYTYKISAFYDGQTIGESVPTSSLNVAPWARMLPGYSQTFEAGPEGWQLQNSPSGFQIGQADVMGIGGNSGKAAAIRSEGHPAGEQMADFLISPVIYPGDFSHPAVSFDYVFKQNPGVDKLFLMWRDFVTGKWQLLTSLDSTGGYSDWKNVHYYLPLVPLNEPIQLAFVYNDFFGQGFGAAIDNFTVYEVAEPAVPDFAVEITDLCLDQTVQFTDLSVGTIHTWEWDFGDGAMPRFASSPGPHLVSYSKAGKKTVKLSLNHLDHLVSTDLLSIREKPDAIFEYTRRFMDISFINKSRNAEQVLWIFGDETTSSSANPVHTYYSKAIFKVQQIASNGPCAPDTLTVFIDMRAGTGIDENEGLPELTIYPNPTRGKLTLLWNMIDSDPLEIKLVTLTGQELLFRKYAPQKEITLDIDNLPDGFYILQITSGSLFKKSRILKLTH